MSQQTIDQIKESAQLRMETMNVAETEAIGSPSVGDVVRQGDLYLICLEDDSTFRDEIQDRQLAPGTTQGSRHVLDGDVSIFKEWDCQMPRALQGPAFRCNKAAEVTHPEHGNKILPAGTTWGVVYQRVHAEEVRRARD